VESRRGQLPPALLNIDEYCKVETSHTGDWIELDMSGGSVDAHLTIASAAVVRLIDALSIELEKLRRARCPEENAGAVNTRTLPQRHTTQWTSR
jgi:hypothetical protein